MIASLPMYDRVETAAANDRLWARVREILGYGPAHLDRETPIGDVWLNGELLLSQTCGLPYRTKLHDQVQLVGTPDYGLDGAAPGYYYSVFVAHRSESENLADYAGKRFAFNGAESQSGWAGPMKHLADQNLNPGSWSATGSHRASAHAVADGQADFAALDAQTWRMIQKYDRFASELLSIARTGQTPGLPLITGPKSNPVLLFDAFGEAVESLSRDDFETLNLRGIERISKHAYLAVPDVPNAMDMAQL
jgi:ABC-type phosphate/phosphonate transport system substrate-binding protein